MERLYGGWLRMRLFGVLCNEYEFPRACVTEYQKVVWKHWELDVEDQYRVLAMFPWVVVESSSDLTPQGRGHWPCWFSPVLLPSFIND